MDLEKLKTLHDKAYNASQVTRERSSDDLVFYYLTHWDDITTAGSSLQYRGQFDILKKAGRQVLSTLAANPVQVDFNPKDETRDDAAEVADGLYRKDDQDNTSQEAYEIAKNETVVCGVAAWALRTEYETNRIGNENQVIKRYPIFEANNTVMWDPNAKLIDKSDADYVSVLTAYSEDGYKELVKELTGEEIESIDSESFKQPEQSYTFPWIGGEGKKIYVTDFYHRERKKEKILTMQDPLGQDLIISERELPDIEDDLLDAGYKIIGEKDVERWVVTKYIASGSDILNETVIPGHHLPIIPMYGEYAIIEGETHYQGITRLAKDPQRLRNFQMSYLADIVSRGPQGKDIFFPEQIQGYEYMYNENGSDNNYPFLLQNMKTEKGQDLPVGAVGRTNSPELPQALALSIQLSKEAIEEVAPPGIPDKILDKDISEQTAATVVTGIERQSSIYQEHFKHAKRRDAEVWASIAAEIYDVPRKVKTQLPDGTKKEIEIMQAVIDEESGDVVFLNDLRGAEFEIFSEIGPDYSTQREQTVTQLNLMLQTMSPDDPMRPAIMLKQIELTPGIQLDEVRDYARKQLIIQGIKAPETDEEKQMLAQQAQSAQEPDAATLVGQAEMLKGKARVMEQEQNGIQMQLDDANTKTKLAIEQQKLITERMKLQVEAQKIGATINKTGAETTGVQLDNMLKQKKIVMPDFAAMSDDEFFQFAGGRAA